MAEFIYVRNTNDVNFLFNTDNIMSITEHDDHTEITLAETDGDGNNLALDTRDTMQQLMDKLRNPLVRPFIQTAPDTTTTWSIPRPVTPK